MIESDIFLRRCFLIGILHAYLKTSISLLSTLLPTQFLVNPGIHNLIEVTSYLQF